MTARLFRRDDELTLGSTATESAGAMKLVARIPIGSRIEDAMYSSYGMPVTLASTRPRSSKARFEYVDLALGAKRGFRVFTVVIRSVEISQGEKSRQNRDSPASEHGLCSSYAEQCGRDSELFRGGKPSCLGSRNFVKIPSCGPFEISARSAESCEASLTISR